MNSLINYIHENKVTSNDPQAIRDEISKLQARLNQYKDDDSNEEKTTKELLGMIDQLKKKLDGTESSLKNRLQKAEDTIHDLKDKIKKQDKEKEDNQDLDIDIDEEECAEDLVILVDAISKCYVKEFDGDSYDEQSIDQWLDKNSNMFEDGDLSDDDINLIKGMIKDSIKLSIESGEKKDDIDESLDNYSIDEYWINSNELNESIKDIFSKENFQKISSKSTDMAKRLFASGKSKASSLKGVFGKLKTRLGGKFGKLKGMLNNGTFNKIRDKFNKTKQEIKTKASEFKDKTKTKAEEIKNDVVNIRKTNQNAMKTPTISLGAITACPSIGMAMSMCNPNSSTQQVIQSYKEEKAKEKEDQEKQKEKQDKQNEKTASKEVKEMSDDEIALEIVNKSIDDAYKKLEKETDEDKIKEITKTLDTFKAMREDKHGAPLSLKETNSKLKEHLGDKYKYMMDQAREAAKKVKVKELAAAPPQGPKEQRDDEGNIVKDEEIEDANGNKIKVQTHTGPRGGKFYWPDGSPKDEEHKVYIDTNNKVKEDKKTLSLIDYIYESLNK